MLLTGKLVKQWWLYWFTSGKDFWHSHMGLGYINRNLVGQTGFLIKSMGITDVVEVPILILKHSATHGWKYCIKEFVNCLSTHAIYILICPCGILYVGQTKHNLKLRIAEHKAAVRNNNLDYAIARHYTEKIHSSVASIRFIDIERVLPNPRGCNIVRKLLKREAFCIYEMSNIEPSGMNEAQGLSCFL